MKSLRWLPYLCLCILLLCFSDTAITAAQSAVTLWLSRVLPALFPFYVASTLLVSGGLYEAVAARRPGALMPVCFLMGSVSGYPVGARLCALSGHSEWSVYCNLCSPAFLLGVVSLGMLGNAALAGPLMIAHYGAALLAAALGRFLPSQELDATAAAAAPTGGLSAAIGDGMLAMLRIGGCVVFFSVCAALIERATGLSNGLLGAGITGTLEMTAGCQATALLALPDRLKCAVAAAMVSFGGLSIYMQALGTAPHIRALPYLTGKAFQASIAFLICYAITPWFCPDARPALSGSMESMMANASVMASLLLAASTGMVFAYLFALVMKRARRHGGAGR